MHRSYLEGTCPGLINTMHIHYDDSLRICPYDEEPRIYINENSIDLNSLWRELIGNIKPTCENCKDFNLCLGGCILYPVCGKF